MTPGPAEGSEPARKVVIVTGASQGIGAGLVDAYRQRQWAVVANSLKIRPSDDPEVLAVAGDVSEQTTAERIISQALDRFGRVDTLVNNAGVFVSKPFTDYTADDYALVTGVNLAGFFWLTQRAIAQMLRQGGGGHVVSISASIARYADSVEPTALAALTKGALAAVSRSLAVEYAARGIRVNAVAPGIIQTPLQPPEAYTPEALAGKLPPLGHVGQVSDVVGAILYLESAPYVTGEILYVDGGRTAGH
jgi:NAD(P)-dependent dehydrogenase (short-subunit alcohol dehydrogenase family)